MRCLGLLGSSGVFGVGIEVFGVIGVFGVGIEVFQVIGVRIEAFGLVFGIIGGLWGWD